MLILIKSNRYRKVPLLKNAIPKDSILIIIISLNTHTRWDLTVTKSKDVDFRQSAVPD